MMNTRMHPGRDAASSWRGHLLSGQKATGGITLPAGGTRRALPGIRAFCGWAFLLLLGWGSAAPASATVTVTASNSPYYVNGTTNSSVTDQIIVQPGGELDIQDGGSVTSTTWPSAVYVQGGTANIDGGTVSGTTGVYVQSGAANISGGSISGDSTHTGVYVQGGTVNISNGSFSGNQNVWDAGGTVSISGGSMPGPASVFVTDGTVSISGGSVSGGVLVGGGTASIYGSCLALSGSGQLTGTLQDGTPINTPTSGLSPANLFGAAPAPVVTLNGDSAMTVECHGSFSDPGATANDACFGSLPVTLSFGSVDTNTPGTYKLTYSATDPSGNTGWVNRWVTVADTTAPVVTLKGSSQMTVECHGSFTDPGASANDACAGSLPVTLFFGSVDANTPGTYKLTYTATDPSGNTAYVNRWVTVVDTTAPVVTLNGSSTMAVPYGGTFTDPGAAAADLCAGSVAVSTSGSVNVNAPGVYTLTYTAVDPSGNRATATRTVSVIAADPSLSMSASPNPVPTGSNLTYTLVVTNTGLVPAQGVVLTDPLPSGTSFASATASTGTLTTPRGNSSTVSWNVGTLNSGQSATLTVVVKVSAKAGATLTNAASVSSSSPDSNPRNNSASVTTLVAAKR
jgi:uncharacterized repeat protein (TIGR01451 family)